MGRTAGPSTALRFGRDDKGERGGLGWSGYGMGRTAGPSTALRSGPNEQIVRPERKSVVGLRPSFSAHVRWCEHGAPLQSCGDRGRLRGRPVVSHRLRLLGLRVGRNCRSLHCATLRSG